VLAWVCVFQEGYTALMIASSNGNAALTKLLLDNGADGTAKDKAGETASDLAKSDAIRELLSAAHSIPL